MKRLLAWFVWVSFVVALFGLIADALGLWAAALVIAGSVAVTAALVWSISVLIQKP